MSTTPATSSSQNNMSTSPMEIMSITITNQSTVTQSYALYVEAPKIDPEPKEVRTDIITVFRGVASGEGGRAYLNMPRYAISAICGTCIRAPTDKGLRYEVTDRESVQLGTSARNGKTCEVVIEHGNPVFSHRSGIVNGGGVGEFCIQTRNDFTYQEAITNRYVFGYGLNTTSELVKNIGPHVLFIPEPSMIYRIKPSSAYYIVKGDHAPRAPVTESMKQLAFKFDLDELKTNDIAIVHREDGTFSLQTAKSNL